QLRLLQTVTAVAAEKNSTLVLPFPVELLRFLERAAQNDGRTVEAVGAGSGGSEAIGVAATGVEDDEAGAPREEFVDPALSALGGGIRQGDATSVTLAESRHRPPAVQRMPSAVIGHTRPSQDAHMTAATRSGSACSGGVKWAYRGVRCAVGVHFQPCARPVSHLAPYRAVSGYSSARIGMGTTFFGEYVTCPHVLRVRFNRAGPPPTGGTELTHRRTP